MINHGNQDQGGGYQYHQEKGLQDPISNPYFNRQVDQEVVSYKECLKNHAASIGGNALDGCGEFMPSIDGSIHTFEALKCSACGCHRNFHRKEVEGESSRHHSPHYNNSKNNKNNNNRNIAVKKPIQKRETAHQMSMQVASPIMGGGASTPSESIDHGDGIGEGDGFFIRPVQRKKRFRTKFSQEQKEKLVSFAEKAGWKMQKLDESVVQQFCQEIGIKRKVLKVWMHNNKLNYVNKNLQF